MKIECHKHWSIFITRGLWSLLFLFSGIFAQDTTAFVALLIIAIITMLPAIISYKTDYIAIEGNILVGRIGFIKSKKLSAPLSKIQTVGISNGLFGKIFGYHTVTIDNAGTGITEYVFKQMGNAKAFVDALNQRISE